MILVQISKAGQVAAIISEADRKRLSDEYGGSFDPEGREGHGLCMPCDRAGRWSNSGQRAVAGLYCFELADGGEPDRADFVAWADERFPAGMTVTLLRATGRGIRKPIIRKSAKRF